MTTDQSNAEQTTHHTCPVHVRFRPRTPHGAAQAAGRSLRQRSSSFAVSPVENRPWPAGITGAGCGEWFSGASLHEPVLYGYSDARKATSERVSLIAGTVSILL